jgi:hypothetical protein
VAGGAAGVGEGGEILAGVDLDGAGFGRGFRGQAPDVLDREEVLERREVLANLLDERGERTHGEDRRGAAVLELVQEFTLLIERVEGGYGGTGAKSAEESDEILWGVSGEDGYAVAFVDAVVLERAAEAAAGFPGLSEGIRRAVEVDESLLIGKLLRRRRQKSGSDISG